MRIAIIVRSLKYGGMERAACNQADAFYQSGHNVDLIYFRDKNKALAPREQGVNLIHMDINRLFKRTISGFIWDVFSRLSNIVFRGSYSLIKGYYLSSIFERELENLEKKEPYDLILIRGEGSFEQIWRYSNPKSVRICVNTSLRKDSTFMHKWQSKCYLEGQHVNCNSEGGKDYYALKLKRENVTPLSLRAIRNPFFKENITLSIEEKNTNVPNVPYILGLGRMVKAKNFELLVHTYIILKQKYNIKHKLVLVGDGSDREYLEGLVEKNNLKQDIIFAGYQKNPYIWMAKSEMLVLTSKFEGLCNVLIEAMACQTRIVACEAPGGIKELMHGRLQNNMVKAESEVLAQKVDEVLKQEKDIYFADYDKMLESLLPSNIVNQWIQEYK